MGRGPGAETPGVRQLLLRWARPPRGVEVVNRERFSTTQPFSSNRPSRLLHLSALEPVNGPQDKSLCGAWLPLNEFACSSEQVSCAAISAAHEELEAVC
jgi:hypothetical protein